MILRYTMIGLDAGEKCVQPLLPIRLNQHTKLFVIFVYENGYIRPSKSVFSLHLWGLRKMWWFRIALISSAMILYLIRKRAEIQSDGFQGFIEVLAIVFGGGNIQSQHRWEKMFFAVAMVASFFLVAIYLADFSMHSTIYDDSQTVNTFDKLSKQNVTFVVNSFLAEETQLITQMLR